MRRPFFPVLILGALLVASVSSPATAAAQDRDSRDYGRFGLNVGLGFLGQADYGGAEFDLGMTLNLEGRFENPVSRYFSIGGLFGASFWGAGDLIGSGADRNHRIDLDLILKPRVAWRTGRGHVELGLPIPVGFTLDLENSAALRNDLYYGWNVGVLVSLQYIPKRSFGFVAEFGWKRHQTYRDGQPDLVTGELILNLGFVFLLAG